MTQVIESQQQACLRSLAHMVSCRNNYSMVKEAMQSICNDLLMGNEDYIRTFDFEGGIQSFLSLGPPYKKKFNYKSLFLNSQREGLMTHNLPAGRLVSSVTAPDQVKKIHALSNSQSHCLRQYGDCVVYVLRSLRSILTLVPTEAHTLEHYVPRMLRFLLLALCAAPYLYYEETQPGELIEEATVLTGHIVEDDVKNVALRAGVVPVLGGNLKHLDHYLMRATYKVYTTICGRLTELPSLSLTQSVLGGRTLYRNRIGLSTACETESTNNLQNLAQSGSTNKIELSKPDSFTSLSDRRGLNGSTPRAQKRDFSCHDVEENFSLNPVLYIVGSICEMYRTVVRSGLGSSENTWHVVEAATECLETLSSRCVLLRCEEFAQATFITREVLDALVSLSECQPHTRRLYMLTALRTFSVCAPHVIRDFISSSAELQSVLRVVLRHSIEEDIDHYLKQPFSSEFCSHGTAGRSQDDMEVVSAIQLLITASPPLPHVLTSHDPRFFLSNVTLKHAAMLLLVHKWYWEDELHHYSSLRDRDGVILERLFQRGLSRSACFYRKLVVDVQRKRQSLLTDRDSLFEHHDSTRKVKRAATPTSYILILEHRRAAREPQPLPGCEGWEEALSKGGVTATQAQAALSSFRQFADTSVPLLVAYLKGTPNSLFAFGCAQALAQITFIITCDEKSRSLYVKQHGNEIVKAAMSILREPVDFCPSVVEQLLVTLWCLHRPSPVRLDIGMTMIRAGLLIIIERLLSSYSPLAETIRCALLSAREEHYRQKANTLGKSELKKVSSLALLTDISFSLDDALDALSALTSGISSFDSNLLEGCLRRITEAGTLLTPFELVNHKVAERILAAVDGSRARPGVARALAKCMFLSLDSEQLEEGSKTVPRCVGSALVKQIVSVLPYCHTFTKVEARGAAKRGWKMRCRSVRDAVELLAVASPGVVCCGYTPKEARPLMTPAQSVKDVLEKIAPFPYTNSLIRRKRIPRRLFCVGSRRRTIQCEHRNNVLKECTAEGVGGCVVLHCPTSKHALVIHGHEMLTWVCNACMNCFDGQVWSFCCPVCDFDLCNECALIAVERYSAAYNSNISDKTRLLIVGDNTAEKKKNRARRNQNGRNVTAIEEAALCNLCARNGVVAHLMCSVGDVQRYLSCAHRESEDGRESVVTADSVATHSESAMREDSCATQSGEESSDDAASGRAESGGNEMKDIKDLRSELNNEETGQQPRSWWTHRDQMFCEGLGRCRYEQTLLSVMYNLALVHGDSNAVEDLESALMAPDSQPDSEPLFVSQYAAKNINGAENVLSKRVSDSCERSVTQTGNLYSESESRGASLSTPSPQELDEFRYMQQNARLPTLQSLATRTDVSVLKDLHFHRRDGLTTRTCVCGVDLDMLATRAEFSDTNNLDRNEIRYPGDEFEMERLRIARSAELRLLRFIYRVIVGDSCGFFVSTDLLPYDFDFSALRAETGFIPLSPEAAERTFACESLERIAICSLRESALRIALLAPKDALPQWLYYMLCETAFLFSSTVRRLVMSFVSFEARRTLFMYIKERNLIPYVKIVPQEWFAVKEASKYRPLVAVDRTNLLYDAHSFLVQSAELRFPAEVRFLNDCGTGRGPTVQFFTNVAKALASVTLGIWRVPQDDKRDGAATFSTCLPAPAIVEAEVSSVVSSSSEREPSSPTFYLTPPPEGFFPSLHSVVNENLEFTFYTIGALLARSYLDGRVVPICISEMMINYLRRGIPVRAPGYKGPPPRVLRSLPKDESQMGLPSIIHRSITLPSVRLVDAALYHSFEELAFMARTAHGTGPTAKEANQALAALEIPFILPGEDSVLLCEHGAEITVTAQNMKEFLRRMEEAILYGSVQSQINAFVRGFSDIVPISMLCAMTARELLDVFTGVSDEGSLSGGVGSLWTEQELRSVIACEHGYTTKSVVIEWLIEVLCELDIATQRKFLEFLTGCPRLPFNGLRALGHITVVMKDSNASQLLFPESHSVAPVAAQTPQSTNSVFSPASRDTLRASGDAITPSPNGQRVLLEIDKDQKKSYKPGRESDDLLISVNTCFLYLKVPPYSSKKVLEKRLRLSIEVAGDQFTLS